MRKRIIDRGQESRSTPDSSWLNLEALAEVEITSEEAAHPIESALLPGDASGWRASEPGQQTVRLIFHDPQRLRRIVKDQAQWNFSPEGTTTEVEDHRVELPAVRVLELQITPDINGGAACASLAQLRLA